MQRRTTSALAGLLVHLAHGVAAAGRADVRELVGLGALRPLVEHDAHDLRDDVAGAPHDDRVADADVLAGDLVLVVQRGVGDHHAADRHRLELGGRRQRAGAADLDLDVVSSRVMASCGGNLWAMAQRGARDTKPSRSCQSSRSTL